MLFLTVVLLMNVTSLQLSFPIQNHEIYTTADRVHSFISNIPEETCVNYKFKKHHFNNHFYMAIGTLTSLTAWF